MNFGLHSGDSSCLKIVFWLGLLVTFGGTCAAAEPLLTVQQVMKGLVTPATNTIWGAFELETDSDWQNVENAAITVIAAGNLIQSGGAGDEEIEEAQQEQWQFFTRQMISAAKKALVAVADRDEAALSQIGNDDLYPPCESCHRVYQNQ